MIVEKTNITTEVNILFNDHVVSKNITLDFTNVIDRAENGMKVVKAGTPINKEGKKATTIAATETTVAATDAVGILLHNCYEDRPMTALIIHGFIETKKAQANSGVTIDATTKDALPMVAFY